MLLGLTSAGMNKGTPPLQPYGVKVAMPFGSDMPVTALTWWAWQALCVEEGNCRPLPLQQATSGKHTQPLA